MEERLLELESGWVEKEKGRKSAGSEKERRDRAYEEYLARKARKGLNGRIYCEIECVVVVVENWLNQPSQAQNTFCN